MNHKIQSNSKKSDLYDLPNLGPRSIEHLEKIGVTSIKKLKQLGPEKTYYTLCNFYKTHMHMAFLYVLRAAVSYANEKIDWDGALKWWMFRSPKDTELVVYYKEKFKSKTSNKVNLKK